MPKFLGQIRGKQFYTSLYRCDKCLVVYSGLIPAEKCEKRHKEENNNQEKRPLLQEKDTFL